MASYSLSRSGADGLSYALHCNDSVMQNEPVEYSYKELEVVENKKLFACVFRRLLYLSWISEEKCSVFTGSCAHSLSFIKIDFITELYSS